MIERELQSLRDGRPALLCGDALWSGTALTAAAAAAADVLAKAGVGPRRRVALLLGNSPEFVVSLIAALKLQASAVLLDPRLRAHEVVDVLQRTHPSVVVALDGATAMSVETADAYEALPVQVDGLVPALRLWRTGETDAVAAPREVTVQCTSGVSGRPKLVPRTVDQLLNELESFARVLRVDDDAATVCPCPCFHAYGLVNGLLLPLFCGRPTAVLDWFLPAAALDLVRRARAQVFVGVPAMYAALCRATEADADLASLRYCLSAGAPIGERTYQEFVARYGVPVHQEYGSTETGTISVNVLDDPRLSRLAVGRPLPGREIAIVHEDGRRAAPDERGEIVVRSGGSAERYLDDPLLTAEKFRDGWCYTGDLGSLDTAGALTIAGRRASFINVGGEKVDPIEVERVLASCDAVAECAVVPSSDPIAGQVVEAVVVAARRTSSYEIRRFCRRSLAGYKVPRRVRFVDALPRSATGKVLTKYLLQ